jgi:hypothetical protein
MSNTLPEFLVSKPVTLHGKKTGLPNSKPNLMLRVESLPEFKQQSLLKMPLRPLLLALMMLTLLPPVLTKLLSGITMSSSGCRKMLKMLLKITMRPD